MPRVVLLLSVLIVLVDQATKTIALRYLSHVPTIPLVPGIFHLTLVQNTGVAFGLFRGHPLAILAGTFFLILGLLFSTVRTSPRRGSILNWSLGLIIGGAVGNLMDRVRLNGVVDFLDFRIWPVFNVADSCITIGALLMAWMLVRFHGKP